MEEREEAKAKANARADAKAKATATATERTVDGEDDGGEEDGETSRVKECASSKAHGGRKRVDASAEDLLRHEDAFANRANRRRVGEDVVQAAIGGLGIEGSITA